MVGQAAIPTLPDRASSLCSRGLSAVIPPDSVAQAEVSDRNLHGARLMIPEWETTPIYPFPGVSLRSTPGYIGIFPCGKRNAAESPQYPPNGPRNPDDVVEFRCDHGDASGADR